MLCVWVLCLPVCLCIMCVQCFVAGQESASDPLGLELQLVMSCRVLLGMNPGPLGRMEKEEGGVCLGKNVKETLQRLDGLRLSMLLTAGCCVVSPKMEELSRFHYRGNASSRCVQGWERQGHFIKIFLDRYFVRYIRSI